MLSAIYFSQPLLRTLTKKTFETKQNSLPLLQALIATKVGVQVFCLVWLISAVLQEHFVPHLTTVDLHPSSGTSFRTLVLGYHIDAWLHP